MNDTFLKRVKLFEVFAGIGSQYKALKNISKRQGWIVESVGIVEWFTSAIVAYQAIHYLNNDIEEQYLNNSITGISVDSKNKVSQHWLKKLQNNKSELSFWLNQSKKNNNFFDIKNTNGIDIPDDIDIFTYSFPCQDISHQGKQIGFKKNSNTRSGLLWEIERIFLEMQSINKKLPKYLLLENVKAIINKKHFNDFNLWLKKLEKFGYESKYYVLNSADFGSAQNRERVFVISVLKSHKLDVSFEFPKFNFKNKNIKNLKDILELSNINFNSSFNKFFLIKKSLTSNNIQKYELKNYTNFQSENFVYDINYSGPTLTASGAMSRIKLYFDDKKIRTMQPKECFCYMGFNDEDYKKIKKTNLISENKMIYLAGNSISIEVLEKIFESFKF